MHRALAFGLVGFVALIALAPACKMDDPAQAAHADPAAPVTAAAPAQTTLASSTGSPAATQAAPPSAAKLTLGAPITTSNVVALSQIAKNPRSYQDKIVATSGTVTAVCQAMGCWMELADDSGAAHVVLAGHKFFVPKDASGRRARVQAKVLPTNADEECAQEAAQQTGKPVAKLELEATGVELD